VFSQNSTDSWVQGIGGKLNEAGKAICVGENGKVFVTGYFADTVDFDPGLKKFNLFSTKTSDVFILCLDSLGNLIWAKQIGGLLDDYSSGIKTDSEGNVYICGSYQGTVDFDPGLKSFKLSAVGGKDIFIVKLNNNGDFIWAKSMGGSGDDIVNGLVLNEHADIITSGQYNSSFSNKPDFDPGPAVYNLPAAIGDDVFVSKLDKNGNFIWAKNFSGDDSQVANAISIDLADNICIVGWYRISIDFSPSAGTAKLFAPGHFENVFVCKLDSDGNYIWAKSMGGKNSTGIAYAVINDNNNNVIISGEFNSFLDFDFDPGPNFNTLNPRGYQDIFICKLDSMGNYIWAKSIGSGSTDISYGIVVDKFGNIYNTGITGGKADFDPASATFNSKFYGGWDGFVNKLNSSGEFQWNYSFGGSSDDYGLAVTVDQNGMVYTTGSFKELAEFITNSQSQNLISNGLSDFFVFKNSWCESLKSSNRILGPDRVCAHTNEIYRLDSMEKLTQYRWIVPSGWSGSSNTDTISTFSGNSDGFLILESTNYCGSKLLDSIYVNVNPSYDYSKDILLCEGDSLIIENKVLKSSGRYMLTYQTLLGCDSLINLYLGFISKLDTSVKRTGNTLLANNSWSDAKYQWIDCDNNNLPLLGQTKQSFIPVKKGSYAVIVTRSYCSDTSSCYKIDDITNSKSDIRPEYLNIFPNPSNGILFIESKFEGKLNILDKWGKIAFSSNLSSGIQSVDLTTCLSGLYIIQFYINGKSVYYKIFID